MAPKTTDRCYGPKSDRLTHRAAQTGKLILMCFKQISALFFVFSSRLGGVLTSDLHRKWIKTCLNIRALVPQKFMRFWFKVDLREFRWKLVS